MGSMTMANSPTFKEMFKGNTHLADSRREVKKLILTKTPAEITQLRRCRCPKIAYEKREQPGEFKYRLCADDVALGRFKHVPIRYPSDRQRQRIIRRRKRQQPIDIFRPRIVLGDVNDKDKNAKENEDDQKENSNIRDNLTPKSGQSVNDDGDSLIAAALIHSELVGRKIATKWKKKALTLESDESTADEDDNDSQVSGEYWEFIRQRNKDRVLTTPDFETDLESLGPESITEQYIDAKGKKRRRKLNQTAKTYHRACARYTIKPVKSFMRQCGKHTVDIRHRMLSHKDARPIAITLVNDTKTSFLDISFNPLGPVGTDHIAQMLLKNATIVELNLSSTFPQREGLEALLESLRHNHTVHRIYLDDNELAPSDGEVIAQMIMDLPSLLELHLANNNLGFEGTKHIAKALATSEGKLNVLNLRYNNIRTDTAVQLANALVKNKTMRSLDLSWNGFGKDGCKALAAVLEENNVLKNIDLTCNRIGVKALAFLLEGLTKNKGLLCIRIGSNPLTTEGIKALVAAITEHKESTLTEIDITGIPIDEQFMELKYKLVESRTIRVHHDLNVQLGTTDLSREGDGTFLDNYDPVLVMFEFMKKDNLRVIDYFQFFDVRKRDKLSKGDLATGFNILLIPFTQHQIDMIMKKLDRNKDGFIKIDEMTKGYTKSDKQVKLRRIRANKLKTKDQGLENLWVYLKSLIEKRKEENALITAINSEIRRSSLLPGSNGSRKGSIFPGAGNDKRGSLLTTVQEGRRGSLLSTGSDNRRMSLFPGTDSSRKGSLLAGLEELQARRGSLFPVNDSSRKGSLLKDIEELKKRRGSVMFAEVDQRRRGSLLGAKSPDSRRGSVLLSSSRIGSPSLSSRRGSLRPPSTE